jgi:putative methionine-R-sulfoxide reductase with GAF domain
LKTYRSPRAVLAEVEHLLASNKPAPSRSPLPDVLEALCQGRHYDWVGIYLAGARKSSGQLVDASGAHPGQLSSPAVKSKVLVSMRIASHEIGILDVESNRENAFGPEDRVLLERVTDLLARFLTGPGKYLA